MEMVYERPVICGNYNCELNANGTCTHQVIAIDSLGKCVMCKPEDDLDFDLDETLS